MDWKRGLKRITHVLAIVIAVACGLIVGFSPAQQYRYARANWWGANSPLVIRQPTEKDLADFKKWQQDNKVLIDFDYYHIVSDDAHGQTLMTVCNGFFEMQRKRFWYNLPITKLIGMVVLYGLGGAVVGWIGAWVILWYGGLVVFMFFRWLALGFREYEQKE